MRNTNDSARHYRRASYGSEKRTAACRVPRSQRAEPSTSRLILAARRHAARALAPSNAPQGVRGHLRLASRSRRAFSRRERASSAGRGIRTHLGIAFERLYTKWSTAQCVLVGGTAGCVPKVLCCRWTAARVRRGVVHETVGAADGHPAYKWKMELEERRHDVGA